jgi:REP element-mobilizing transposase RayT
MPNTYSQLYVQVVFAVQGRQHFVAETFRERLQQYITGIVQNQGQKMLSVYCMPDHIHMLVGMKPDLSVSELVRDVKANSSSFIKNKLGSTFSWQKGFGAFSYSRSQLDDVAMYINNQPLHHKEKTFREEYIEFLKRYKVEFDENYLFEFY